MRDASCCRAHLLKNCRIGVGSKIVNYPPLEQKKATSNKLFVGEDMNKVQMLLFEGVCVTTVIPGARGRWAPSHSS